MLVDGVLTWRSCPLDRPTFWLPLRLQPELWVTVSWALGATANPSRVSSPGRSVWDFTNASVDFQASLDLGMEGGGEGRYLDMYVWVG